MPSSLCGVKEGRATGSTSQPLLLYEYMLFMDHTPACAQEIGCKNGTLATIHYGTMWCDDVMPGLRRALLAHVAPFAVRLATKPQHPSACPLSQDRRRIPLFKMRALFASNSSCSCECSMSNLICQANKAPRHTSTPRQMEVWSFISLSKPCVVCPLWSPQGHHQANPPPQPKPSIASPLPTPHMMSL